MESTTLLLGAIVVVALLMYLFRDPEKARRRRLYDKIPGAIKFPLVGNMLPYLFLAAEKRWYEAFRIITSFRPFALWWIGEVPVLVLYRPEHYETVLNNTNMIDKADFYNILHAWLGTGLLTSTGKKWHAHRKLLTPTFHFKILENFIPIFAENTNILVKKLGTLAGGKASIMDQYISNCSLDIICEAAMGTSINAQQSGTSKYVEAVDNMKKISIERVVKPYLLSEFIFKFTKLGRLQNECLKIIHSFTRQVIRERKAERLNTVVKNDGTTDDDIYLVKKRRLAFLDMLLEAAEKGEKITDDEIQEEVDTFMFEGHDTVTSAIISTVHLLGFHPDIQDRVYEELESIFQGSNRSPNLNDLHQMKYLEMVNKEALRLYPSVPLIARKAQQDFEIDGYTVPVGTTIGCPIYALHTNPEVYPNPLKFDPDNFLPERVMNRHPYAYVPFSAGPRNCIGQKFAMLEMKSIVSSIIRNYEVKSVGKMEDIVPMLEIVFRSKNGCHVFLKERKGKTIQ